MQLENSTQEEKYFVQWLLDVKYRQELNADGYYQLPGHMKCGECVDSLLNAIYPGITVIDLKENNDQYFLECAIWMCIRGGDDAGKRVFIPRITLCTSNNDLPFELHQCQFPVHLAFAMTINNKS